MGAPHAECSDEDAESGAASASRAGDGFPGILATVAEISGREAALRLAAKRGGGNLYIPRDPRPHHILVRVVGLECARRIAAAIGHGSVFCPLGPLARNAGLAAQIAALEEAGCRKTEIARRLRVSIRTVERHRAQLRERERQ